VRLLLDVYVSGAVVGRRLEANGHDVRALDQEPALEGLDDDEVLALAAQQGRILVTHNVSDFPSPPSSANWQRQAVPMRA
jgi:predicted nuclease of predicted toxin-antitoxin system